MVFSVISMLGVASRWRWYVRQNRWSGIGFVLSLNIVFSRFLSDVPASRSSTAIVSISRRGNGNDVLPLPVCLLARLPALRVVLRQAPRFPPRYPSRVISFRFAVSPCRSVVRCSLRLVFRPVVRAVGRGVRSSMREAGRGAGSAPFSVARQFCRLLYFPICLY